MYYYTILDLYYLCTIMCLCLYLIFLLKLLIIFYPSYQRLIIRINYAIMIALCHCILKRNIYVYFFQIYILYLEIFLTFTLHD